MNENHPQEVDLILLKKVLIVYATKIHEINYFDYKIDVQVKFQSPTKNSIFQFFKLDLGKIQYSDISHFMYGLSYRIEKHALHVFGPPDESFAQKIVVLQIVNSRQKILKELWIYGTSSSGSIDDNRWSYGSEARAKGKEYEIF